MKNNNKQNTLKVSGGTYFVVIMLSIISIYFLYSSVIYQYWSGIFMGILVGGCALWFLPQTEELISKFVKTTISPVVRFLFSIFAIFLIVALFVILFITAGIWIAGLSTSGIIIFLLVLILLKK